MNIYERLHHGENFKMSDFRDDRPFYLNIINDLRCEKITGQYDFEGDMRLQVVKPVELAPGEVYRLKRQEALSLIFGGERAI